MIVPGGPCRTQQVSLFLRHPPSIHPSHSRCARGRASARPARSLCALRNLSQVFGGWRARASARAPSAPFRCMLPLPLLARLRPLRHLNARPRRLAPVLCCSAPSRIPLVTSTRLPVRAFAQQTFLRQRPAKEPTLRPTSPPTSCSTPDCEIPSRKPALASGSPPREDLRVAPPVAKVD